MTGMFLRIGQPYLLVLLLAIVPVLWWSLRAAPRRRPRVTFSTVRVLGRVPRTLRQTAQPLLPVLRAAALALLVLALAHPTISRPAEDVPGQGIDIALAIDVSYSMSATDLGAKNRLETAKDTIRDFVAGRSGDRIGLVAFAADAVTVSPLTSDYPMLLRLLDDVSFGRLPEGTAIGHGLANAVNLLRDASGKSRVIILLTDGQNNAGDIAPEAAARMAQLLNMRAYTIGVGAVPPETRRGGNLRTTRASDIDEDLLRQVAETTGASYFRAVDQTALKQIYDLISRLEKTPSAEQKFIEVVDLTGYLLAAAGAALLLEVLLASTWLRRVP